MHILGYHVFDPSRGWLQDDEKTWVFDFDGAAQLTSHELADAIGKRETHELIDTFYVLACMGSP